MSNPEMIKKTDAMILAVEYGLFCQMWNVKNLPNRKDFLRMTKEERKFILETQKRFLSQIKELMEIQTRLDLQAIPNDILLNIKNDVHAQILFTISENL